MSRTATYILLFTSFLSYIVISFLFQSFIPFPLFQSFPYGRFPVSRFLLFLQFTIFFPFVYFFFSLFSHSLLNIRFSLCYSPTPPFLSLSLSLPAARVACSALSVHHQSSCPHKAALSFPHAQVSGEVSKAVVMIVIVIIGF